jgi:very-short-patch-repair endonuclease
MTRLIQVPDALKHGPFTIDQAAACGIRRQRLGRPNFKRIVRGVYIWSGLAAASNAQLLGVLRALPPASVFSGLTAARIRGLDLSPGAPNEVVVPLEAGVRSRPDLIVRREALRAADVVEVDGVPVTSVTRTWFDLARRQALIEAVTAVDWALHSGLLTKASLSAYVDACGGWNGIRQARKVIELAESKSESLMESRLRMHLVLGGLPRPESQAEIRERAGGFAARIDLYYRAAKLGIEFDGDHHRATFVEDNRRQNALLLRFGIRLLRFTGSDVYRRPDAVVAEVRQALTPPSLA